MTLPDHITDTHHARETLIMVQKALSRKWRIGDELLAQLPTLCEAWANDPALDERTRVRAVEVLRGMEKDNKEALIALAREVRLDTPGEATEKQEIRVTFADGL